MPKVNPRDTTSHVWPCPACSGTGYLEDDKPCFSCDTDGTTQSAGAIIAYELVRNQIAGNDTPAYERKQTK